MRSLHEHVIQPMRLREVGNNQPLLRRRSPVPRGKVVVDPNVMPSRQKQPNRMTANVTGAAGNEYSHVKGMKD